ncbi:hypothetical protein KAR91_68600 [Candidatus Pacearchaeota archaeon]|nr:hypothetical protein [Candidatus Pacearchaeota archaeon]
MFELAKFNAAVKAFNKAITELHRRRVMPNIKITAEVNGKQVPLETVSTETFEAIKALEKPKEIPVARIGHYKDEPDDRRLFLRVTNSIRRSIVDNSDLNVIAINLQNGCINNSWSKSNKDVGDLSGIYENIKPL